MKFGKEKIETKEFKIGDKKTIHKFAWWPVTMPNGVKVWLEKYKISYKYQTVTKSLNYPEFKNSSNIGPKLNSQGAVTFPAGYFKNEWCIEEKSVLPTMPFYKSFQFFNNESK